MVNHTGIEAEGVPIPPTELAFNQMDELFEAMGEEDEKATSIDKMRQKTLSDGILIRVAKSTLYNKKFVVHVWRSDRSQIVTFTMTPKGLEQIDMPLVRLDLGEFETPINYRNSISSVKDPKFLNASPIMVNWVKQLSEQNQYSPPPLRLTIAGV